MKKQFQHQLFILFMATILMISCESDVIGDLEQDEFTPHLEINRECGLNAHMDKLLSDPAYRKQYELRMTRFKEGSPRNALKAQCSTPTIIPVAVHYQGISSNDQTCLIDLAKRQIEILNSDFAGTNNDIGKWVNQAASYFPGVSHGEACIRFVLADQNHPSGYGLNNGDLAITFNQTQGDQVNTWSGYLNIFVQSGTGVLGYAPLGGLGNGDGVVIEATAFGAGSGCGSVSPEAPYNLGRTTTHEVGHYLLLDHIWGNGCNIDDDVNDTPDQSSDYGGCPSLGSSSCGSTDMHMNYMDYTNDACMYMFSAGQASRMENYLNTNLDALINNASSVYSGAPQDPGGNNGGDNPDPDDDGNDPTLVCQSPSSATVNQTGEAKVLIDWEDIESATRYRIRFKVQGTSGWTRKNSSVSQKTLSNLTPGMTYVYQLRTRCPDGWTSWSTTQSFTLDDNSTDNPTSSSKEFTVEIELDDYGSETTWYIVDQNFTDLASGGPYSDFQAGTLKRTKVSLDPGCYELEIYDAYGDGMCCDYGNGSIYILDDTNQVVAGSDGRFGSFELISFCIEGGSSRITNRQKDPKKLNRAKKSKNTSR